MITLGWVKRIHGEKQKLQLFAQLIHAQKSWVARYDNQPHNQRKLKSNLPRNKDSPNGQSRKTCDMPSQLLRHHILYICSF